MEQSRSAVGGGEGGRAGRRTGAPRARASQPVEGGRPGAPAGGGPGRAGSGPVTRHSVRGQILESLRAALVAGELVPGEVYSAPALAARFGVSPTPVREAMQRLATEGAVETVPNRGFRVALRSDRELAELAEVRALLEVPALLRLAGGGPPGGWDGLRALAATATGAAAVGDRVRYTEADRAFHRALLALAGNEQLVLVADELYRRVQAPVCRGAVTSRADLRADAAEHEALLDALAAGNAAVVERLARAHVRGPAAPRPGGG
ncbi:GntR family transcriptional regulator [Streptomyces zingiberis]|uniref:GntR family transcriptional regulator n=1 Tax=Streptomyces zingiberis TaxID=2053010 RepID=A0ABX1C1R5_9ACTN|nr:GntR family transcriptional regulator [Streptomyces zingiberis]NJQ03841.1 GntR family transcriptional regulator [Streptomyces zingiberis]